MIIELIENFPINIFYIFIAIENFTDSGLTNFGKSLENLPALNSISLDFELVIKKINIIL